MNRLPSDSVGMSRRSFLSQAGIGFGAAALSSLLARETRAGTGTLSGLPQSEENVFHLADVSPDSAEWPKSLPQYPLIHWRGADYVLVEFERSGRWP